MRIACVVVVLLALSSEARGVRVGGYVRRSTGTYVAPSHRTSPDRSRSNNWSSKGNVNPYTGKQGSK